MTGVQYVWASISYWRLFHRAGKEPVRLTYWLKWSIGTLSFTRIPVTVQMFIQSGVAIAEQIEIDFFFFFFPKYRVALTFGYFPEKQENGFKFIQWTGQRDFRIYLPVYVHVPWSWCSLLTSPKMLKVRFSVQIVHEGRAASSFTFQLVDSCLSPTILSNISSNWKGFMGWGNAGILTWST